MKALPLRKVGGVKYLLFLEKKRKQLDAKKDPKALTLERPEQF